MAHARRYFILPCASVPIIRWFYTGTGEAFERDRADTEDSGRVAGGNANPGEGQSLAEAVSGLCAGRREDVCDAERGDPAPWPRRGRGDRRSGEPRKKR